MEGGSDRRTSNEAAGIWRAVLTLPHRGVLHYCVSHHGWVNPNPNPNPYEIYRWVPPIDVTAVKWLKKHNNVYICLIGRELRGAAQIGMIQQHLKALRPRFSHVSGHDISQVFEEAHQRADIQKSKNSGVKRSKSSFFLCNSRIGDDHLLTATNIPALHACAGVSPEKKEVFSKYSCFRWFILNHRFPTFQNVIQILLFCFVLKTIVFKITAASVLFLIKSIVSLIPVAPVV